jgi:hypothetical protein
MKPYRMFHHEEIALIAPPERPIIATMSLDLYQTPRDNRKNDFLQTKQRIIAFFDVRVDRRVVGDHRLNPDRMVCDRSQHNCFRTSVIGSPIIVNPGPF